MDDRKSFTVNVYEIHLLLAVKNKMSTLVDVLSKSLFLNPQSSMSLVRYMSEGTIVN